MNRHISKVAVLGSGIMGSRLACHFANIGVQVVLLDIPTPQQGVIASSDSVGTKQSPSARNKLVNDSLQNALKSSPSPIYLQEFASRITTGNFEDDFHLIADCDWILEAVIEKLDIKKQVFEQVEKYRRPGSLITTNTSGIPIEMMLEGRSDDFGKHFCGTHFFNPPRYLQLLEVIPSSQTAPEVVDFLMHYGDLFLGKTTVLCKDTPAFIANRVGIFAIMAIFHLMEEMDLTVDEVDALTGPLTGRPKSATFRTCDLVGIDTLVKVAEGVRQNCPNDESRHLFETPSFVKAMLEKGWVGEKAGQGFYKKIKNEKGESEILTLDAKTLEYKPKQKAKFASVEAAKLAEGLIPRQQLLDKQNDKAAEFIRRLNYHIFSYVSHRIPEIADHLHQVDEAIKAGFGWEIGAFELWDALAPPPTPPQKGGESALNVAGWAEELLAKGGSFYRTESGKRLFYNITTKSYDPVPSHEGFIILDNLRGQKPVWQTTGNILHDLGDGVLCLEFRSKVNAIGTEEINAINKSLDIAEKDFAGLVIGNEGANFSAGANLAMMLMAAVEQEFDTLEQAIRYFQNTVMRMKYAAVPVVVAPHGLALGGACELVLHATSAVASAETYIGLVEVGVGLIPGGGGTKEMVVRISDSFTEGDTKLPHLQKRFVTIATAKVAASGHEAFEMGIFDPKKDEVVINPKRLLLEAKEKVLELHNNGYVQRAPRSDIEVMGRTGLGLLLAGSEAFHIANYATAHDLLIARKLAWIMCGGDLSYPQKVSEQYLLDLEREAFLSLLAEPKTLQRIESVLKTGKPIRN